MSGIHGGAGTEEMTGADCQCILAEIQMQICWNEACIVGLAQYLTQEQK
jgi:hypothetical protein